jgi:hypothetical protein
MRFRASDEGIEIEFNPQEFKALGEIKSGDILQFEDKVMAKFIQKAVKKMEEKGTKGAFTAQAKKAGAVKKGGGIKTSFIDKELHSSNPTTRKRAQFAKNMKKIAKAR